MATDIAKAYVQIIPSAEGISGKITDALGGEAESAGKSSGQKFSQGFSTVIGTAGKVMAGAVAAGAAAVGGIVKSAVSSFSEYEQLVGGVETLFGEASETVIKNADNAFKTAGLSANDYMQTVTSFSASLLQSVGGDTAEAARVADMALIDMADNANKMGTSMQSIQDAYQGFAKQNYTMLDNLKLGYGGTKTEMQRLLADAQKLTGVKYDISNLNDVYEAIHAVQENLGITGTTAKEASTTIQGSLASMKAAWVNVLTGMGTEGSNMNALIENLLSTVETFVGNIMPVIETAMTGVSTLVERVAPVLAERLPAILTQALPGLLQSGVKVVESLSNGILQAIPTLMPTITDIITQIINLFVQLAPQLIEVGMQVILELANGISEALPTLIPMLVESVTTIVDTLIQNAPMLIDAGIQLILALVDGILQAIPMIVDHIPELVQSIVDALITALPMLIDGSIQLVQGIAEAMPEIITAIVDVLPEVINTIVEALPVMLPALIEGCVQLVVALAAAWPQIIQALIDALPQIVEAIAQGLVALAPALTQAFTQAFAQCAPAFDQLATMANQSWAKIKAVFTPVAAWFKTLFTNAVNGVKSAWNTVTSFFQQIYQKIVQIFASAPAKFAEIGRNIVEGIKNGINAAWSGIASWLSDKVKSLIESAKSALSIGSPSKAFADEVGQWIPAGIAMGIEQGMGVLNDEIQKMTDDALVGTITATTDSVNSVNYMPSTAVMQPSESRTEQILAQWLPIIADSMKVDVNVVQNDRGTYEAVNRQNSKVIMATGYHALA